MLTLPAEIMALMSAFAPVFSERIWDWVPVLVFGAILAPGKRTVTSALRVMGLGQEQQFQNYHRVLNRAKWSSLQVSQVLLGLLVMAFVPPNTPLVMAADETLERRRGKKIKAKGYFRDPVRSCRGQTVKSHGLRWVSMMLLVAVPWSSRVWALPFLTVLAPSEETNRANGQRHKTSIDWTRQMIGQVRRWLPTRKLVFVVDGGLTAIKVGLRCARFVNPVTYVSRLQLNAQLFDPPGPQPPSKRGPKPCVGPRQTKLQDRVTDPDTAWQRRKVPWYGGIRRTLDITSGTALWYSSPQAPLPIRWVLIRDPLGEVEPQAFFATDPDADPVQIITWFVMRWNVEVTFEEVRTHLGFETQRQWNDLAIARTSPAILGLFSFVALLALHLTHDHSLPVRSTAWYIKPEATFSDALAFVRRYLWTHVKLFNAPTQANFVNIPVSVLYDLVDTLCDAV
jgi:hypothetical protein